jgi:hypothetical protein
MKRIILLFLVMASIGVHAAKLSQEESKKVASEIKTFFLAFQKGDLDAMLKKTHKSIYNLCPKDVFDAGIKKEFKKLLATGIKIENYEVGKPGDLYPAGDEEVCFFPTTATMTINNLRIRSIGYIIAIRKTGTEEWRYLDGAGFKKDNKLLWVCLPKLTKNIKLPPNFIDSIKEIKDNAK